MELSGRGIQADHGGCTPLHHGARHGHLEVVHILLDAGAAARKGSIQHLFAWREMEL